MATHRIGPDTGMLVLRTSRQGFAAQVGHDLTIEVARWSGTVTMGDDASVRITAEIGSLRVLNGTGGVKPLSERDKREILGNAAKTLHADRFPELTFVSSEIAAGGDGSTVEGTCTLHGTRRPLRLDVASLGGDRYRATGTIVQTEYGIKPYTGMFGALKVADAVSIEAEIDLSAAGDHPSDRP